MIFTEDLCQRVGPLLNFSGRLSKQYMNRALRDYDIPPIQGRIIQYLAEHQGKCTQKELATVLMVKPSTVNGVVCRLEEKNMIIREDDPEDARCKILYLSEYGRQFLHALCQSVQDADHVALHGFSAEEENQFYDFLRRVIQNYLAVEEENQ